MNATRRKALSDIIDTLRGKAERFESEMGDAKDAIEALRDEEQEYYDNMPENLQGGENGDAASTAIDNMETLLERLGDDEPVTDAIDTFLNDL